MRPRTIDDLAGLDGLAELVRVKDGYPVNLPGTIREFLAAPGAFGAWVADLDGDVVGHVALHNRSWDEVMEVAGQAIGVGEEDLAVVARLLVSPQVRPRGTGGALLDVAVAEADRLGRYPILDVDAGLTAAVALYERGGWVKVGTVQFPLPNGRMLTEYVYSRPGSRRPSA